MKKKKKKRNVTKGKTQKFSLKKQNSKKNMSFSKKTQNRIFSTLFCKKSCAIFYK